MVGIFQGEKTSTNPFCTINSDWQLNVTKAVGIMVVGIFQQTSVESWCSEFKMIHFVK